MSIAHHLVVGAGPVGSTTALQLADADVPVRLLTRSGSGPAHPNIHLVKGDAAVVDTLVAHSEGAAAIYNCVNPPYHRWPTDWPPIHRALMTAAERTGAVLVMTDNLYSFGPTASMPMHEGDPMTATGSKGATRAMMANELLAAHAAGRLRATFARASDFFGPMVRNAWLGERVVPKVIAGKKVSLLGELDVPHHSTYVPDLARTLITIATDERAWGKPWHVPCSATGTQRQSVEAFAVAAGTRVKVGTIPGVVFTGLGLFMPAMREMGEVRYQFERPWLVDSTLTETTFGLKATPLSKAALATIDWWRTQA
jgi:nucleoside-diphosphate-sugar epimerase